MALEHKLKVVLADISKEHLDTAETELSKAGVPKENVLAVQTDVTSLSSLESLRDQVYSKFGQVDGLFCFLVLR